MLLSFGFLCCLLLAPTSATDKLTNQEQGFTSPAFSKAGPERTCPPLAPVLRGSFACTTSDVLVPGTLCHLRCQSGHIPLSEAQTDCTANGVWSVPVGEFSCVSLATSKSVVLAEPQFLVPWYNITVLARDMWGEPTLHSRDVLFVSDHDFTYSHIGNSSYSVSIFVPRAGTFMSSIYVNGHALFTARAAAFPGEPDRNNTVVDMAALVGLLPYQNTFIKILARDSFNNSCTYGASGFHVSVTRTGMGKSVPIKFYNLGNGTYQYFFNVTEAGTYALSVMYNGSYVKGSPFNFVVASRCPIGSRDTSGAGQCMPCDPGYYGDKVGALSCTICPSLTLSPWNSTSVWNCTCMETAYTTNTVHPYEGCQQCPGGGYCAGGSALPVSRPGFQIQSTDPYSFLDCGEYSAACLGNNECAPGHHGVLCSICELGYYRVNYQCLPCTNTGPRLTVLAFVLMTFGLSCLLVWINKQGRSVHGAASFTICFDSFQVMAIAGSIALPWPAVAQNLFRYLSFSVFNLELVSPECAATTYQDAWILKWGVVMALPALAAVTVLIVYALTIVYCLVVRRFGERWARRHPDWVLAPGQPLTGIGHAVRVRIGRLLTECETPRLFRGASIRAYYQMLGFCFMPLCLMTMRYWDCVHIAGKLVMRVNPVQECFVGIHYQLVSLDILFIILYCVGIPLTVGLVLFCNREFRKMEEEKFVMTFAVLTERFKREYYYGEVLVMLRKVAVAVSLILFYDPYSKVVWVCVAIVVSTGLFASIGIYLSRLHNYLFMVTSVCTAIALLGGITPQPQQLRGGLVIMAVVVLLTATAVTVPYDIYRLRKRRREAMNAFYEGALMAQVVHEVPEGMLQQDEMEDVDVGAEYKPPDEMSSFDDQTSTDDNLTHNNVRSAPWRRPGEPGGLAPVPEISEDGSEQLGDSFSDMGVGVEMQSMRQRELEGSRGELRLPPPARERRRRPSVETSDDTFGTPPSSEQLRADSEALEELRRFKALNGSRGQRRRSSTGTEDSMELPAPLPPKPMPMGPVPETDRLGAFRAPPR